MYCWLIIVPPLWIVAVGLLVPLCCADILFISLGTFIDVVVWISTCFHCVSWLTTFVTYHGSFSLSCRLAMWLSFSFVLLLSFEGRSLSNFLSFSFKLWGVVALLMLTVAPVTFSFVTLFAFLSFVFALSFSLVAPPQNVRFTTVLSIRQARNAVKVARFVWKFAFYHSFGRPTITFCVKGRSDKLKICILPQFWASDTHEVAGTRKKFGLYHSFERPTRTKWREGCQIQRCDPCALERKR